MPIRSDTLDSWDHFYDDEEHSDVTDDLTEESDDDCEDYDDWYYEDSEWDDE